MCRPARHGAEILRNAAVQGGFRRTALGWHLFTTLAAFEAAVGFRQNPLSKPIPFSSHAD
jgi:hypothetical protein